MGNSDTGSCSDTLNEDEVNYTKECACTLSHTSHWCDFLNNEQIERAVNVEKNKNRTAAELISIKSALFEVRVAFLIHSSGLNVEYEYSANPNNDKSIDFKVSGNKLKNFNLLIEISSLRESELQKDKTWTNGDFFGCILTGDDDVSAYFKAQKVLIEKAKKFPSENIDDQINTIILDMRSPILGCSDCDDYKNILYGSKNLDSHAQRYTNDNKLFPGIFCPTHPGGGDADLNHLRKSIHYFGFVVEKKYTKDELANEIRWFKNPDLDSNDMPNLKEILNGVNVTV